MEKLEHYLNNIITRQQRLEKLIIRSIAFLILTSISSVFINAIFVSSGEIGNFYTAGVSGFVFSSLGIGIYVVLHLHSCMNGCEFIKIQLHEGGLIAAENMINNTKCTKNIDTEKLKSLANIGDGNGK